jgi:hypothetical protein
MKVQCTVNYLRNFTKSVVYDVYDELSDSYQIVDDRGMIMPCPKDWFVVVPEQIKPKEIVCVRPYHHPLTMGNRYSVLSETAEFYRIIDDEGNREGYQIRDFEVVTENKPTPSKIRMIEYPTTTDDKIHLSQEKAEAHQLELDTQSFKGPFIRGIQKLGIGTMVAWASTNPESFETLVRLVREQQSNE